MAGVNEHLEPSHCASPFPVRRKETSTSGNEGGRGQEGEREKARILTHMSVKGGERNGVGEMKTLKEGS